MRNNVIDRDLRLGHTRRVSKSEGSSLLITHIYMRYAPSAPLKALVVVDKEVANGFNI